MILTEGRLLAEERYGLVEAFELKGRQADGHQLPGQSGTFIGQLRG
jgi:hypothetical protein